MFKIHADMDGEDVEHSGLPVTMAHETPAGTEEPCHNIDRLHGQDKTVHNVRHQ